MRPEPEPDDDAPDDGEDLGEDGWNPADDGIPYVPGPVFERPPALKPTNNMPAIWCRFGTFDSPDSMTESTWVLATDRTEDPRWWRERLGAVAFSLTRYSRWGDDALGSHERIGAFAPSEEAADKRIKAPPEVVVMLPGGKFMRASATGRDAKGLPVYAVSLADWVKR